MTARADQSCGKLLKNETAFPLCTAKYSLWNMKVVSLLSSVTAEMRFLTSSTSSVACWLHESAVSVVSKKKWFLILRGLMLSATGLAASPCSVAVKLKWDSAKASGTVTSHCDGSVMAQPTVLKSLRLGVCHLVWQDLLFQWQLESVLL